MIVNFFKENQEQLKKEKLIDFLAKIISFQIAENEKL